MSDEQLERRLASLDRSRLLDVIRRAGLTIDNLAYLDPIDVVAAILYAIADDPVARRAVEDALAAVCGRRLAPQATTPSDQALGDRDESEDLLESFTPEHGPLPPTGDARHFQARFEDSAGPRHHALPPQADTWMEVWIGRLQRDTVAAADAMPEVAFHDGYAPIQVTVAVTAGGGPTTPVSQTLLYPERGDSRAVAFLLQPDADATELRAAVVLLNQGRVLQEWELVAPVALADQATDPIRLVARSAVRRAPTSLASRPAAGARFLEDSGLEDSGLEDSGLEDRGGLRGGSGSVLEPVDLDLAGLDELLARIDAVLTSLPAQSSAPAAPGPGEVATVRTAASRKPVAAPGRAWANPLESDDTVALIRRLAQLGGELFQRMWTDAEDRRSRRDQLRAVERIQVVSSASGRILPLELCYDRAKPRSNARLCRDARAALQTGRCDCEDSRDRVCPLGFWGVRKVIERQVQGGPQASDFRLASAGDPVLLDLGQLHGALFAGTARADSEAAGNLDAVQAAADHFAQARGVACRRVETWAQWEAAIAQDEPRLLVLIPHTETGAEPGLEIGEFELLPTNDIGASHVVHSEEVEPIDPPYPTALLLFGCTTATQRGSFEQIVPSFQRWGAEVVFSTLNRIRGRHAAPLARGLLQAMADRPGSVGDLLRHYRRAMLLEGYPAVLGVVSFGDPDWRIG